MDPVVRFWVLTLSFCVRIQRYLASLERSYKRLSGETLGDGSFYGRFTPKIASFLKACVIHAISHLVSEPDLVLIKD